MKGKILFVLMVGVFAMGVQAEEASVPADQYFGLGAGFTSGLGLSYRSWAGPWGWQINAMPLYDPTTIFGSVGLTGLLTIHDARWSRFFTYAGTSAMASWTRWNPFGGSIQGGGGIGIEFIFFDHLALDGQVGLASAFSLTSRRFEYLGVTGEAGIYYRL